MVVEWFLFLCFSCTCGRANFCQWQRVCGQLWVLLFLIYSIFGIECFLAYCYWDVGLFFFQLARGVPGYLVVICVPLCHAVIGDLSLLLFWTWCFYFMYICMKCFLNFFFSSCLHGRWMFAYLGCVCSRSRQFMVYWDLQLVWRLM